MKVNFYVYALIALEVVWGSVLRFLIDEQIPSLAGTLIVNFSVRPYGRVLYGTNRSISENSAVRPVSFSAWESSGHSPRSRRLRCRSFEAGAGIAILNLTANLLLGFAGILVGRHLISFQRGI